MTLSDLRDRFDLPHKMDGKGGWFVRCPSHADCSTRGNPSLHLTANGSGRVLVFCFAGCPTEEVLSARGLALADLMPLKDDTPSRPRIIAIYDYRDEAGTVLYQVVRFEPKGFRQRRPDPTRPGKYLWNLEGVRRVLYRLPELRKKRRVLILEGEKDVDRAWTLGFPATTNAGGARKWTLHAQEYLDQLSRMGVYELVIIPDQDEPGLAHARQVIRAALDFGGFDVRFVALGRETSQKKGFDLSDWLDQGHTAEELTALIEAAAMLTEPISESDVQETDTRPCFPAEASDLKTLMPDVLHAVRAWNAAAGSPRVYNVSGDATRLDWSAAQEPVLVPIEREHYLVIAAEAARWDSPAKKKDAGRVPAVPPRHVLDALRAEPATFWPELRRFVAAPFFRPDGSLVSAPGYDAATGLYCVAEPTLRVPAIPTVPSRAAIQTAVGLLRDELLADFLWRDDATDRANALSIMLTPVVRPFYRGHTPLAAISKPVERAGAGLLLDVLLLPTLGRFLPRTSLPERTDEVRKSLFAMARAQDQAILFDNVDGPLDQSPLAAFLTSDRIRDRILGVSQAATVAQLPLLYVTGIGITVSSEMAPRICLIELDPRMEHPETRSDFRHAPLRDWAVAQRGCLLGALLTLVRATIAEGWPIPSDRPIIGDFQEWADRVASVLHVAGVPGFLRNRDRLRAADPVGEGWRLLFRRCRERFPPAPSRPTGADQTPPFTAGQLWALTGWKREERDWAPGAGSIPDPNVPRPRGAPDVPLPLGFRETGSDRALATSFGLAVRRRVGKLFDGWRLEEAGDDGHNARAYRLIRVEAAWVTDLTVGDDAGGATDGA